MNKKVNIEERYEKFMSYYNSANLNRDNQNYKAVISSLRSALENLSIIIICDVEKNNSFIINSIFEGRSAYKQGPNETITNPQGYNSHFSISHYILGSGDGNCINTRGLIFTAQKAVLKYIEDSKYRRSFTYQEKQEYYNLQQRIYSLFKDLGGYFYTDSSEIVHPGSLDILGVKLDERTIAEDAFQKIRLVSEYLRALGIWSDLSRKSLGNFIKSEEEVTTGSNDINESIITNNEIERLKVATCNFSMEQKYILILPEYIENFDLTRENDINALYALMNSIKPILVIDFNKNTEDGIYRNIPVLHDRIHLVASYESEISYIAKSEYINWLFAEGNCENPSTMNKDRRIYKQGIQHIVKKICDITVPTNITVISFVADVKRLGFIVQTVENKQQDANFYILSGQKDIEEDCQKFSEYYDDITLSPFNISVFELAVHMVSSMEGQEKNTFTKSGDCQLFFRGKTITIPESEVISYREAGIEFVNEFSPLNKENTKDNFYAGGEVSWNDLSQHKDVDRDRWNDLLKQVEDIINKSNDIIINFDIFHEPGAGATTLSRRLAYEIEKRNRRNELQRSCNVIILFKNIKESDRTVNQLIKLSQKIENNRLMVLYESCNICETEIEFLKSKLGKEGEKRKLLFVQVRPLRKADVTKRHDGIFILNDELSRNEFIRFAQKYSEQNMSASNKRKMMELVNSSPNVIDFPLLLHEGEVSKNLQQYIDNQMDRLPVALQETVALLSFAYYYSEHMSVNIQLFRNIFKDDNHVMLRSYRPEELRILNKLLIKDTVLSENHYRPRYSKFAEFIMQNFFGKGIDKNSTWNKYPSRLKDAAIHFIDVCGEYGEDGVDDDLFLSIFIQRRDDNYRADDEKRFITKFSKLIQDINDEDRANDVLKHLCDTFPDNPYYNAHYGRFLFERARENNCHYTDELFNQAKKYVDIAVDNNSDNSDVYHIRGMYYCRLIGSLRNIENINQESRKNEVLVHLEEWTTLAEDSFSASETKTFDNAEYAYAAEASLYKSVIELGRNFIGAEDYNFCEDDPWLEYVENLGKALSKLGDVVNNDENINQKTRDIYGKLLGYYCGIFGDIENTANRLFNSAFNGRLGLDRRCAYGKLYFWVSIYGQMNKDHRDRREIYRQLDYIHYHRLETILENNIKLGDIESYDKLFELRLYGRGRKNVYTLEEAKSFVLEWHDMLDGKKGQSLLTASYYLGVISAAQAIINEKKNKSSKIYEVDAIKYFQESKELATELKKKTIVDYCAMGRMDDDIRCLVRVDSPNSDKSIISGVFTKIKTDKSGVVRLDCGLEATLRFDDREIPDEIDVERARYKGIICFRYAGLAMYGATKVREEHTEGEGISSNTQTPFTEEQRKKHIGQVDRRKGHLCVIEDTQSGEREYEIKENKLGVHMGEDILFNIHKIGNYSIAIDLEYPED